MKLSVLFWSRFAAVGLLAAFVTGCGDIKVGDRITLNLDPATQQAKAELEMSDNLEVSLSGSFPIDGGKGEVYFVPATKETPARIGIAINIDQLIDIPEFDQISELPSGNNLPVAMTPPLYKIRVLKNKDFQVDFAGALSPELQVSALVGIAKFSSKHVPAGIAVCQNFRNSQKIAIAAVCIYGPNASGSQPGGIFLGGNFGAVIKDNNAELLASGNAFMAMSRSSAPASQITNFHEVNLVLDESESQVWDPKKKLKGDTAIKTVRNVEKVLRVRR